MLSKLILESLETGQRFLLEQLLSKLRVFTKMRFCVCDVFWDRIIMQLILSSLWKHETKAKQCINAVPGEIIELMFPLPPQLIEKSNTHNEIIIINK